MVAAVAALLVAGWTAVGATAAPTPTTWCGGTSVVQTDRKPELLAGDQISVVYAHPTGVPDRFASFATPITSDVAAIDGWWRKNDATRTPRFDLYPFGVCSGLGDLDLADVTLPQPAATFAVAPFAQIVSGLVGPPYRATSRDRKYLVYWDAPVADAQICGQGSASGIAIVYVRACGVSIGDGDLAAAIAAHELIHALGAVAPGAPHECPPPNNGHVCDDTVDILYPYLNFGLDRLVLDVNHDDYYGNGGPNDLRNSPWLERLDLPQVPLTVTTGGSGAGRVTSDAGAVSCPGSCSTSQEQGQTVNLTASPDAGSSFVGWSGACSGARTCSVTLDSAKDVHATFAPAVRLLLSVSVHGKGRVVSVPAGLSCRGRCSGSFLAGRTVTLHAVADRGYLLGRWGGACHGAGTCTVRPSRSTSVAATFVKA
jgi:List-Bact-rpt repeat protein